MTSSIPTSILISHRCPVGLLLAHWRLDTISKPIARGCPQVTLQAPRPLLGWAVHLELRLQVGHWELHFRNLKTGPFHV